MALSREKRHPEVMEKVRSLWALAFVLALSTCTASQSATGPRSAPTAPSDLTASALPGVPTHNPSHSSPGPDRHGTHSAPELNPVYLACARKQGFDPQVAEVFVDRSDKPLVVKTGYEVPADVHRPCWIQLGGDDPFGTSYGNGAPSPSGS
jgi:hypothetical protein